MLHGFIAGTKFLLGKDRPGVSTSGFFKKARNRVYREARPITFRLGTAFFPDNPHHC